MKNKILITLLSISIFSCTQQDSLTSFKIKVIDQNIPTQYTDLFIVATGYEYIGFPNSKIVSSDTIRNNINGGFDFSLNNSLADEYFISLIDNSIPTEPTTISIENLTCLPFQCSQSFLVGKKYEFDIQILP